MELQNFAETQLSYTKDDSKEYKRHVKGLRDMSQTFK